MKTAILRVATHAMALAAGFAAGIYALPILTAPEPPTEALVRQSAASARYTGEFRRDLAGSDALHWGEGRVFIGRDTIVLEGELAPGPDYKLYLSPEFVETETDFARLAASMVRVGDVQTFENFVVDVPAGIDPADFTSVIVWCESFGRFITAARYRD